MSPSTQWHTTYRDAAIAAMNWMLDRPRLNRGFVNTKLNPITLVDYGLSDGERGPGFTYGWIQGRALEALAGHARALRKFDPILADRLKVAALPLHETLLSELRLNRHFYFCYNKQMTPIIVGPDATILSKRRSNGIYTYADIFAAKGLLASATTFGFSGRDPALAHLLATVDAVENGRFQIDERQQLCDEAIASQPDDFGPRMILLGAANLLVQTQMSDKAAFSERFVQHVLLSHQDTKTGLLRNVPMGTTTNIGHAIEFAGFAMSLLPKHCDPDLRSKLNRILHASFATGFTGHGLALEADIATGSVLTELTPWWSLPETIRAASISYEQTGDEQSLHIWRQSHDAFFRHFWRTTPPIAYQMLSDGVPVDLVPATPDLDPGYHTGLCLLSAAEVLNRIS